MTDEMRKRAGSILHYERVRPVEPYHVEANPAWICVTEHRVLDTKRTVFVVGFVLLPVIIVLLTVWSKGLSAVDWPLAGRLCLFYLAAAIAHVVIGFFRQKGYISDQLEITRELVSIKKAFSPSSFQFPYEELEGFRCRSIDGDNRGLFCLELIRIGKQPARVFASTKEDDIRAVIDQCRNWFAVDRPSPMQNAILPPRPKL